MIQAMPLNWGNYDNYFCGDKTRSQKPISDERKQALECGMADLLELDSHWRGTLWGACSGILICRLMSSLRGNGVLGAEFSPGCVRTFDGADTNARPSILPFYHDVADECDFRWSRMRQALLNESQQDQQRVFSYLGKHHRIWSNVFLPLFLLSPFWESIPYSIRWRRGRESNPRIPVLQTSALPLCYLARRVVCEGNPSAGLGDVNWVKMLLARGDV